MKRMSILSSLFFCCVLASAGTCAMQTVPNPHLTSVEYYVANPDGILSDSCVAQLNQIAHTVYKRAEVEMVTVAIDEMANNESVEDFAQSLFNSWGIGKAQKNTGVLILLVRNSRDIRIHTGGGLEGILPDGRCSDILQDDIIPLLSDEKWDEGILAGAKAIANEVTTDDALAELLLDFHRPSKAPLYISYYLCFSFFMLILLAFAAYKELNGRKDKMNNIRYQHAKVNLYKFQVCGIFFAVPCAFFLWWYLKQVKRLRTQPMLCPECKKPMRLLSEEEEDIYLNNAEQAEERVKSMDYDVWFCPSCLNHITLPYEQANTQYTQCPYCHAKTYTLQSDVITRHPTTLIEGRGEKTYRCEHCGKTSIKTYIIPCVPVVVATGGRHGSGGGLRGGSFGGGISFGGGASGKF